MGYLSEVWLMIDYLVGCWLLVVGCWLLVVGFNRVVI